LLQSEYVLGSNIVLWCLVVEQEPSLPLDDVVSEVTITEVNH